MASRGGRGGRGGRPRGDKPCRLYRTPQGCRYGARCTFVHEGDGGPRPDDGSVASEVEKWQRTLYSSRDLGFGLNAFFKDAFTLVQKDHATRQEVIDGLSTDRGLAKIRECLDGDFQTFSSSGFGKAFAERILPLFRTITHAKVLSSALLESKLAVIYGIIFGVGGNRAQSLFAAISRAASEDAFGAGMKAAAVEACLSVLLQIFEHHSSAQLMASFSGYATILISLIGQSSGIENGDFYADASRHAERISKRLSLGKGIPYLTGKSTTSTTTAPAPFKLKRDGPGVLANGQSRHNNDFADIQKISIMPTFEEIVSSHGEYLPFHDPASWHLLGIAGLVDRHFRLVREDAVGQLRDSVRAELQALDKSGRLFPGAANATPAPARTYSYHRVCIDSLEFDNFKGLVITLRVEQPVPAKRNNTEKERQRWWTESRRLSPDALVCLVSSSGCVLFCTVSQPKRFRHNMSEEEREKMHKDAKALFEDEEYARVNLQLVYPNFSGVTSLFKHFFPIVDDKHDGRSLIEFPGVLLPSFFPTLTALQRLSHPQDLPFSDVLAPSNDGHEDQKLLEPPLYAQTPGFVYRLPSLAASTAGTPSLSFDPRTFDHEAVQAIQDRTSLDASQASAVAQTLSRGLALIQGPPGTGKSFTGVALIKSLLDNKLVAKLGPIICVCYTNHALDQLLEHLVDAGITQIVRIGSRSKSEKLQNRTIQALREKQEATKVEDQERRTLTWKMCKEAEAIAVSLNSAVDVGSPHSIRNYLHSHHPSHGSQLFRTVDAEGFQLAGPKGPGELLRRWVRGGQVQHQGHNRGIAALQNVPIHNMNHFERARLYNHWLSDLVEIQLDPLQVRLQQYNANKECRNKVNQEIDLRILHQADIIGVTTSGLARNFDLLRKLPSKVLVCEEAGEVLEAHLLTALLPSIEHAIMIGDHQQLRPHIQNYELSSESKRGERYSLDRSLFERLVVPSPGYPHVPFETLNIQRRMHSSISELIRRTLYPALQDANVDYPKVVGMAERLFWLDHKNPEAMRNGHDVSPSHTNDYEVEMSVALVSYLVKQGAYKPGQIAVLTPYLGQLKKIRSRMQSIFEVVLNDRDELDLEADAEEEEAKPDPGATAGLTTSKASLIAAVRVATVDNFQGEEAEVVVISLVRSNPQQTCGFLKTSNRINVLLSRAKHGMYIIGDTSCVQHIPMWSDVLEILHADGLVGNKLQIQCQHHPSTLQEIDNPEDFLIYAPEGGCTLQCGKRLSCGHTCTKACHSDILHNSTFCMEPCSRPLQGCDHLCPNMCGDPCPRDCKVLVGDLHVELPCGHVKTELVCYKNQDHNLIRCTDEVEKTVPGCGHVINTQCHIDVKSERYDCREKCGTILPCGHTCAQLCRNCKKRKGAEVVAEDHKSCKQPCGRPYTTCSHSCTKACHGDEPCPLCIAPCQVCCSHSACQKKCHEPCAPCAEADCSSHCEHSSCTMPCAAPCDYVPCSIRCGRELKCGHQCPSVCGEKCPSPKYCQFCASEEIKDRTAEMIMFEPYRDIDLDEDPIIVPSCGHFLTISSMDGHVQLSDHYELNSDGTFKCPKVPDYGLDSKHIEIRCPECRLSLRDLARYGRPTRRGLLIESTLKFITWSNREYQFLFKRLMDIVDGLEPSREKVKQIPGNLIIKGEDAMDVQKLVKKLPKEIGTRYKPLRDAHAAILSHTAKVKVQEQPFERVKNLVRTARQRSHTPASDFDFDPTFLQTRAHTLAWSLLRRTELALYTDLLAIRQSSHPQGVETAVDFSASRADCIKLSTATAAGRHVLQQTEALLFCARFVALELAAARNMTETDRAALKASALATVEEAKALIVAHPGQTQSLAAQPDEIAAALAKMTFYAKVSDEEMRAVVAAMAQHFLGTGHWYYCANGHPFTIGECGMAMQLARCPECGAAVGGGSHALVEGNTRAGDLEERFGEMGI